MSAPTVPGYELLREIGRGGTGSVFLARGKDGREVAIKCLTRKLTPAALERFAREARLLSGFGRNEGFVPLLGSGMGASGPFLVMPFVPGGTLRRRLDGGPLAIEEAVALVKALAAALSRAHARGIVHRDMKPENVLYTAEGEPLVADLGLAKHFVSDAPGAGGSVQLSRTGDARGTVGYMPREQMHDATRVAPPADVFALGCILHECLTGRPAFEGASPVDVLAKVEAGLVSRPSELRPEVPAWLDAVVVRALARDPAARFADGAALEQALARRAAPIRRGRLVALLVAGVIGLVALGFLVRGPAATHDEGPAPTGSPSKPVESGPAWFRELAPELRPQATVLERLEPLAAKNEYRNKKDGSVLVFVPAGEFLMGDDDGAEGEKPRHKVELSAYLIGKYETSVAQWRLHARDLGPTVAERRDGIVLTADTTGTLYVHVKGATWETPTAGGRRADDDTPVVEITHEEAMEYAAWAGLRLPTEAEWERAAGWTGTRLQAFPWGDEDDTKRRNAVAFFESRSLERVTSHPDGASPVGCFNMAGNAAEWVIDTRDTRNDADYREDAAGVRDPCHVHQGELPVSRGGCFNDFAPFLRTYHRRTVAPEDSPNNVTGFRVALSADGSPRPRSP